MPQLRCAQTSEILAEGTPLEIATAAEQFAKGDVIFDDVGGGFDPAAVRQMRADEIAGLQAVLAELPARPSGADADATKAYKANLQQTIDERNARIAAGTKLVPKARDRMAKARERVDKRRGE